MSGTAMAATTATQTITYTMPSITNISVTGTAVSLTLVDPDNPLNDPTPVTNGDTSYNIWTNKACHITGAITPAMPSGLTLKINLASTGGTSAGDVTLGTTAASLVTAIAKNTKETKTITYTLSADKNADPGSGTTTVTLTIVAP